MIGKQHVSERDTSMSQVFSLTYEKGSNACTDCGRQLTAEERLLSAILGEDSGKCKECFDKQSWPKCGKCGVVVPKGEEVYYVDKPYHIVCLPGAEYELP